MKKCLCIPHLLKSLVFVVHHQIEVDGLAPHAAERRLKMLVQAFRLSLGILSSRREPWLTYKHSSAEVNRLYTVLTAISVEFHVPKEISHEINGILNTEIFSCYVYHILYFNTQFWRLPCLDLDSNCSCPREISPFNIGCIFC